jgi:hypothetical protein
MCVKGVSVNLVQEQLSFDPLPHVSVMVWILKQQEKGIFLKLYAVTVSDLPCKVMKLEHQISTTQN